jgi:mannobiose 2-epimerase
VELKEKISELLIVFETHIIDKHSSHLNLFLNKKWECSQNIQSFGHDIEASWLLHESAVIVGDPSLIAKFEKFAIELAQAALQGIGDDGGLFQEYDVDKGEWLRQKHWWSQAEGMVGFMNAWQLTGDPVYLEATFNCWKFIKEYIIDEEWGEWHWGVYEDHTKMNEDKAGFWKCPYHNSRACIEVVKRINSILTAKSPM